MTPTPSDAIAKRFSRRNILGTVAAGGLATAAGTAAAQTPSPEPHRDDHHGGTDHGPRNPMLDAQNPDILNPPPTDHGTLPNLRFSFSDSHVRQEGGGWTRQVTVR